jgi:hypothetical protein
MKIRDIMNRRRQLVISFDKFYEIDHALYPLIFRDCIVIGTHADHITQTVNFMIVSEGFEPLKEDQKPPLYKLGNNLEKVPFAFKEPPCEHGAIKNGFCNICGEGV